MSLQEKDKYYGSRSVNSSLRPSFSQTGVASRVRDLLDLVRLQSIRGKADSYLPAPIAGETSSIRTPGDHSLASVTTSMTQMSPVSPPQVK